MFALLSSDVHGSWAWERKTTLQADMESLRYAHGNIFETFPFPSRWFDGAGQYGPLEALGLRFFEARQSFMNTQQLGLTKFYNAFHDSQKQDVEVLALRELQDQINREVIDIYGWSDIDPLTGFHAVAYLPPERNVRFTISERARFEVIRRLSKLNRERFEQQSNADTVSLSEAASPSEGDLFSEEGAGA
jgi:hypothetical protein